MQIKCLYALTRLSRYDLRESGLESVATLTLAFEASYLLFISRSIKSLNNLL